MMRDALIIVAIILVVITIIVMFGGCVSCSNGRYDNEGMNSAGTPAYMDSTSASTPAIPKAVPVASVSSSPAASPAGGMSITGYDTSGSDYATFRLSS